MDNKKTERFGLVLSSTEKEAVQQLAELEGGLSQASLLRYLIRNAAKERGLWSPKQQTAVESMQHGPQIFISLVIVGENNMGDNIVITGNKDSIFNVKTDLTRVHQSINRFSVMKALVDELQNLNSELEAELCQVPDENEEEAEAVLEYARSLVEEATKAKPNKTRIMISADGLMAAAKNIATIMPTVLMIATQIVETIMKFKE